METWSSKVITAENLGHKIKQILKKKWFIRANNNAISWSNK